MGVLSRNPPHITEISGGGRVAPQTTDGQVSQAWFSGRKPQCNCFAETCAH